MQRFREENDAFDDINLNDILYRTPELYYNTVDNSLWSKDVKIFT